MDIASWETDGEQKSAQGWFEKGEAALGESKHSEAAGFFGNVLKYDPFNAKAHCRLSDVYRAQGKTEDALNSMTRALELEPGDRETVLSCAGLFSALGKEDFAKEVIESYLEKNPQDQEIRSILEPAVKQKQPENQDGSNDAAQFLNRHGEIVFGRGSVVHAVACFQMAIEENPRMAEAYNNLGVIYLQGGKIAEALEHFHKAHELKPEDAAILGNSAKGLARAGHIDAAIEVYREYLRRSPQDNEAWLEFESLIRRNAAPDWKPEGLSRHVADIYLSAARELGKAGDLKGASHAVERALKIKPPSPESLHVLASLHCAIGQKDEAESILGQALSIDPSHGPCSEMLESIRNGTEGFKPFMD